MNNKKLKLIYFGDPVLREKARPVTVFHKKLHLLVDSISKTLAGISNGAALAANQVNVLKRVTVINYEKEYIEMINPEILFEEGAQTDYEGCLSYPDYLGIVKRAEFVKVKYYDRNEKENIIERNGNMARCIQHEIDHLNGILFIDRMFEDHLVHSKTNAKINLQDVLNLANGIKSDF